MNAHTQKLGLSDGASSDELKPGTSLLQGQYVIDRFINSGGFGMTYLASNSLGRRVVIKECFPASICSRSDTAVRARSRTNQNDFRSIVQMFVQEAWRLAKLEHSNIVGVHQVFEDNDTAYMALDYVDGLDLLDLVEADKERFGAEDLRGILMKLLDAIGYIHSQNILHRDISPDNILVDKTGNPILIDFGAAREKATKSSRVLSAMLTVKDGYSPQEFYIAGTPQGPASDIYALAATFYHLITGKAPPSSQVRLAAIAAKRDDPYRSLTSHVKNFDQRFLAAIDKSMSVFAQDRLQSASEWLDEIDYEKRREKALAEARRDKNIDLSISRLVSETNRAFSEEMKQNVPDAFTKQPPRAPRQVKSTSPVVVSVAAKPEAAETAAVAKGWFFKQSGPRHHSRFSFFGKSRADQLGKANT